MLNLQLGLKTPPRVIGESYRGMKSGSAHLQPILGMLRSTVSEAVLPQKCTTPHLGCKKGENRRENEETDEGVTAVKELQQTRMP